jgi:transcriptional regulator with XRE-family HTH domain
MNKLKEIRFFKEVSQFRVGVATGISPSKLSLIENDLASPKPDEKKRIADFLGVSIEEIFPEVEADVSTPKK